MPWRQRGRQTRNWRCFSHRHADPRKRGKRWPATLAGQSRHRFPHQFAQRLLADHGPNRPTDGVIGMIHGCLREREQDPALAVHVFEVGEQLLLDPVVGASVHLVHDAHQEVHEAVGDLGQLCPPPTALPSSSERPATSSSGRSMTAAGSLATVRAQNRSSASRLALPIRRPIRPGGSRRPSRQRDSSASRWRSSRGSTEHTSAASQSASRCSSARVGSR